MKKGCLYFEASKIQANLTQTLKYLRLFTLRQLILGFHAVVTPATLTG